MNRLHHVNVVVPPGEGEAVAAFYTSVFGFERIDKAAGTRADGAWLALADGIQLHLSEREGTAHQQQHFAVVVDDFDGVRERLAATRSAWQDAEDIFGGGRGFTFDPAGNRIEVLERAGSLA